ncbi:Gamma-glutamyl hydrolase [Triticum urartu]|uniref:folate gamma-glutamyl hydrolase n=1 Tax=Triticum urartu TaxID=4572 RepID=M8B4Z5_TRIUA|nr:Gamma-glutamyl hydrolase [Triticum urartu]
MSSKIKKLSLVNGVLFTGGSVKRGPYFETIKKVFQYVLDKNDAGVPFPLFAQCLGFELVSMIVSKEKIVLVPNLCSFLIFLYQLKVCMGTCKDHVSCPGLYKKIIFHPDLIKKLSTSCLVMQNHKNNYLYLLVFPNMVYFLNWSKYGISPKRLRENDALSSFFKILTISPDENGEVYVSTVEAQKYPITCTQWHPEKAIFEWRKPMIPHSEDAVQVTQNFANYFISQARKSPNRPPADKVLDNLIYNYIPTFSGKTSTCADRALKAPRTRREEPTTEVHAATRAPLDDIIVVKQKPAPRRSKLHGEDAAIHDEDAAIHQSPSRSRLRDDAAKEYKHAKTP